MRILWLDSPAKYEPVWQAMENYTHCRTDLSEDQVWLTEHQPVFTLGQAGLASHILNPQNIPIVRCNRGGQVTYHGPGQVVMYTLVDLRRRHMFIKQYVSLLERTVIDVLLEFGVIGPCRKPGAPGIYVPQSSLVNPSNNGLAKIAALGLKVSRGCVYHGIAVNVSMDLSPFNYINPCGYAGLQTVDMRSCGVNTDVMAVGNRLAECFKTIFDYDRQIA